jgi:hypothetical protein
MKKSLEAVVVKFKKDMAQQGINTESDTFGENFYQTDIKMNLPQVYSSLAFRSGKDEDGQGVYAIILGRLTNGVKSVRDMAEGMRIISELDFWMKENGKVVQSGLPDNPFWAKYKIDPQIYKKK